MRQNGITMIELVVAMVVLSVLASVAVPGVARVRGSIGPGLGARRLTIVLRAAQARAQTQGGRVVVTVGSDGRYVVADAGSAGRVEAGDLGVQVDSTFPAGALEFTPAGWACLPGAVSPRAGHFVVSGGHSSVTVVVQLSGCVRCG